MRYQSEHRNVHVKHCRTVFCTFLLCEKKILANDIKSLLLLKTETEEFKNRNVHMCLFGGFCCQLNPDPETSAQRLMCTVSSMILHISRVMLRNTPEQQQPGNPPLSFLLRSGSRLPLPRLQRQQCRKSSLSEQRTAWQRRQQQGGRT